MSNAERDDNSLGAECSHAKRLEAAEYVPGVWECPQCGFVLVRNFLHAETGNVAVNDNELDEPCPNDGSAMRRQTWRSRAEDAERIELEDMTRLAAVESALREMVETGLNLVVKKEQNDPDAYEKFYDALTHADAIIAGKRREPSQ